MAISEAALQVLPGAVLSKVYDNLRSNSPFSFKYHIRSKKYENYRCISQTGQRISRNYLGSNVITNALESDIAVNTSYSEVGSNSLEDEAWSLLRSSMVYYCGSPIGTIAAIDSSDSNTLNYDQVFIRDFIPSAIAFLLNGEYEIVRNFILHTLQLQVMYSTSFQLTLMFLTIAHAYLYPVLF